MIKKKRVEVLPAGFGVLFLISEIRSASHSLKSRRWRERREEKREGVVDGGWAE